MTETQQSRWRWAGRILIGLAGVAGILAAANQVPMMIKEWAALAVALLGFAARWCEQQLPAARGPAGPAGGPGVGTTGVILLIVLLAIAATACTSPYAAAKRSTWALMRATQTAGDGLGGLVQEAHRECLAKNGQGTEAYKACMRPWRGRLQAWHGYGRPAARTSVATLYGSVRLAEAAKAKPPDVIALLKTGGCALLSGVREWGHLLPDKASGVLQLLAGLDPAICLAKKSQAAAGAVAAGLTLALEIVAWIRRALADPVAGLWAEVDAWLRVPPKDTSDAAAAQIREHLPKARHAPPRR
jgi:hypothetical protein